MINYNIQEFLSRLILAGLEERKAMQMIVVQDHYNFNLGLQDTVHYSLEGIIVGHFNEGIGEEKVSSGDLTYGPFRFEEILQNWLSVSAAEELTFTKVESDYLEFLGVI